MPIEQILNLGYILAAMHVPYLSKIFTKYLALLLLIHVPLCISIITLQIVYNYVFSSCAVLMIQNYTVWKK